MNNIRRIDNIKQVVKITMILLVLTHASYGVIFYFLDIFIMAKVKIIEAAIALLFAIFILMIGKFHNIAVYFTHFSILISCALCTYFIGQDYGFLIVMITILSLGYVHDFKNSKYPMLIGMFEIVFVIFIIYFTKDIPNYESEYKTFFYVFNIVNIVLVVVFYSSFINSIDENEAKSLEKENVKLQNKADYDYLTNILNRRAMNEILKTYHGYFQKDQIRSFVVVLGDIDNFKSLNDECGHNFGDIVLKNTAKLIKDKLVKKSSCYVSRWGGEEFLVFLTGHSIDECEELINEIKDEFSNFTHKDGYNARKTTITFGVCYALRVESIDYMLSQADSALYKGKKSGKNKVETIVLGQI